MQCLRELADGVSQYKAFAEWTSEFSGRKQYALAYVCVKDERKIANEWITNVINKGGTTAPRPF